MSYGKIRVLQILHNLKKGGVQADVMYPARILSSSDVKFDVLLLSDIEGEYEDEFRKYGNIFRIPLRRPSRRVARVRKVLTNPFTVYRQTLSLLTENGPYDAVHVRHMMFIAPCLMAAKKAGVPVRIGHSHVNAPDNERLYIRLYLWIAKKLNKKYATLRLGVTKSACEYLFDSDDDIHVIKTPTVDLDKFDPSRFEAQTHDGIEMIQIGSFGARKNQMFTLDVLKAILQKGEKIHLTLIGYAQPGSDIIEKMTNKITELELSEHVTFLPSDTDVAQALSRSDIMILPSLQEGLPNTALEAQAMGVPCFLSTDISTEADCGLCTFLPLDGGAEHWADSIISYARETGLKKRHVDMSSYDNKKVCQQYLALWSGASWEESEKCLH